MQDGSPEFSRSLILNGTAYANIAVYSDKERIKVFYFGVNEKEGRKLVEEEIGVRLRKANDLETHFTRLELKQIRDVSARRESGPIEI